jgi:2,4-dienoyl-CoA reductase-like NADH-dependent reductase (Old Yellow Enzyme family)
MLAEPMQLKSLTLGNRMVRSATWEGLAAKDGTCTAGLAEHLGALVTGGAGLIITGFAFVHTSGKVLPYMMGIEDDSRIAGLRGLTEHIHGLGGRIAVQISHGGGESRPELIGDHWVHVPSLPERGRRPKLEMAMTDMDIAEMVACFGRAAFRARESGFDALQIQGGHGYLISQFLSPMTNRRTDRYGGSLENRARFLFEVYEATRGAVGESFSILAKMNADDFMTGGLGFEEALWVMKELARMGIDAIEVSGGVSSSPESGPVRKGIRPGDREAYFASFAHSVRQEIAPVPVIAVGGIRSFPVAEGLLASGAADMVALSRPLICEPDLPNRWLNGDMAISSCVSCNRCFLAGLGGKGIACRSRESRQ